MKEKIKEIIKELKNDIKCIKRRFEKCNFYYENIDYLKEIKEKKELIEFLKKEYLGGVDDRKK